jgi:hypothetical protein
VKKKDGDSGKVLVNVDDITHVKPSLQIYMLQNISLFILCVNTLCFSRNKGTFKRPVTQYYFLKFTYQLYINWQTIGELK